jgi:hypothetical protein
LGFRGFRSDSSGSTSDNFKAQNSSIPAITSALEMVPPSKTKEVNSLPNTSKKPQIFKRLLRKEGTLMVFSVPMGCQA